MEIIREIKERYKNKCIEVEIYVVNPPSRKFWGWHTDSLKGVGDNYSEDDNVIDYKLMDIEEYNNTILANCCFDAEDLGYEKDEMILCIIKENEK